MMSAAHGKQRRFWSLFRCLTKPAAASLILLASLAAAYGFVLLAEYESGLKWPEPKVVDPGPLGGPPSDAVVLFDGKDLSQWEDNQWIVKDGYAVSNGTELITKQGFGDCQLHLEWATPEKVEGSSQGRGNSGVFLMQTYEVQILDSYQNVTYFDGQAGAIYKQHPPLVNVCRKPGEWQTYDIIFTAPSVRQGWQARKARLRHRAAKRRAHPRPFPDSRQNRMGRGSGLSLPSGKIANRNPISWQPREIQEYLDSRTRALRTGKRQSVSIRTAGNLQTRISAKARRTNRNRVRHSG
jgi:hypothetical protein